jgi:hypothetical protein
MARQCSVSADIRVNSAQTRELVEGMKRSLSAAPVNAGEQAQSFRNLPTPSLRFSRGQRCQPKVGRARWDQRRAARRAVGPHRRGHPAGRRRLPRLLQPRAALCVSGDVADWRTLLTQNYRPEAGWPAAAAGPHRQAMDRGAWTWMECTCSTPWMTPSPSTTPSLVRRSPEFIQPCRCCFHQPCIRHADTG